MTGQDLLHRGRGRPRRWKDEAERSRAYRAAKAQQLAEPLALRRQVQGLRTALRGVERDLDRERRAASRLQRQVAELAARSTTAATRARVWLTQLEQEVAAVTRRAESAEARCEWLASQQQPDRSGRASAQSPTSLFGGALPVGGPQLNRAQRRALERRR